MSKSVVIRRRKLAKSEKQYVRGIIHNLSLQRWTDQEISNYLRDEKNIDIGRSTISNIKNKIEKEGEKWYFELRNSRYKYIATYKERLDSLMSYQKKLHQIVELNMSNNLYQDTVIRAISELHRIEISIFNIWKQLPDFSINMGEDKRESDTEHESTSLEDPIV